MNSYVDLLPQGDDAVHTFLASDTASSTAVKVNAGVSYDEVEMMS